ncbi:MAG: hypothetical protein HY744_03495 [Deltaproteobacteria bacterium]|nr:hypothetical protein [Deltaproteobacteria bacterium]
MQPGQSSIGPPAWFEHTPVELRFGTSGLRGLVRDMTDLEICVATSGFLAYLKSRAELDPGEALAIAEDLRLTDPTTGLESSPRIARAVARAARDAGLRPVHCGRIPTPALAHWAMRRDPGAGKEPMACVMVTGSHIPADRNGVKFYRKSGEILKADEAGIIAAVGAARTAAYAQGEQESPFDARGMLKRRFEPEPAHPGAERAYVARYAGAFGDARPLAGRRIVVYQHGAVGRDLLVQIFAALGADVVAVGRSEEFVPVDTEDISPAQEARYAALVAEHRADALVSTDGDGDRPLVVDETGRFRRGDVLGTVAAGPSWFFSSRTAPG